MREMIRALYEPILKATDKEEPSVRSTQPASTGQGVLDQATCKNIEADRLFEAVNTASTLVGQAVLYRSLIQPLVSAHVIQAKQEALQELEANARLRAQIEDFVASAARKEKDFYILLFKKFVGLLGMTEEKTGIEGYGYGPYKRGVRFMLDLVEGAKRLPTPQSLYLKALIDEIRDLGSTRSYALMRGPVHLVSSVLKTKDEKKPFTPSIIFRPTLFKPLLLLTLLGSAGLLVHIAPLVLGYAFFIFPALLLLGPVAFLYVPSVGEFDRDRFIYPLREGYKRSSEVQHALDALGKLDELLSFYRYARSFGSFTVLPKVVDADKHFMIVRGAKNPALGKGNPAYVANEARLDGHRLTFITGPNSGGKTAFCKTLAQIQLLAQIGCYIPATTAELAVADRIFYQAPESGSLEDEEGRFGTELRRTKNIFVNTSPKSLVILDELAEGTTYEEKLEISSKILSGFYRVGNNTLLVTHNHALCEQFRNQGIGQYRQVEFVDDRPTFRLVEGISRVSHADRVAKRIGFAEHDIERHLVEKGYVGDSKEV
jgi:DNA mismatch repair protein MutS